jgi:hypothetical protein
MFFSKVDKEKYPEATQELRFELVMKGERNEVKSRDLRRAD